MYRESGKSVMHTL